VVFKELAVGSLRWGSFYGCWHRIVAQTQPWPVLAFAFSVGLGVCCSMTTAALVGSFVPMMFARINIDPAVATGPFVTTAIDIISVYLLLPYRHH
jgi:magnesium transporter